MTVRSDPFRFGFACTMEPVNIGIARFALGVWGMTLAGCGPKAGVPASPPSPASSPVAKPSASPTPALPVSATVQNADVILLDGKGRTIAKIKAKTGAIDPQNPQMFGKLGQGTATLYKEGKPEATLTAENFVANRTGRTITATGKAVAKSLTDARSPEVRANQMVWAHDKNEITGTGNVLATMKPDWKLPGSAFKTDTALTRIEMTGAGKPATGTF